MHSAERFRCWTPELEHIFKPVLRGEGLAFSRQINAGIAECWRLDDFYMITRQEGSELVVCCGIGKGLQDVAPLIVRAAQRQGCRTIRFHTQRPALARMLERFKFSELERVYQMEIEQ